MLLLVTSLSLTIQSHSYHKSKIISSANFFTGGIYERINNVDEYFGLKSVYSSEDKKLIKLFFDATKQILNEKYRFN